MAARELKLLQKASERLESAAAGLRSAPGDLKAALLNVAVSQFAPLVAADFPMELQDRFDAIENRLTNNGEASFDIAIAELSESEASEVAQEIVDLARSYSAVTLPN